MPCEPTLFATAAAAAAMNEWDVNATYTVVATETRFYIAPIRLSTTQEEEQDQQVYTTNKPN